MFDVVHREDYKTEADYIQALAKTSQVMESDAYRRAVSKASIEARQREEAEIRKAQREEYAEIRKGIKLSEMQQKDIDKRAGEMARADLAAGKIGTADLGRQIEKYAAELGDEEKSTQAAGIQFNNMLRALRGN